MWKIQSRLVIAFGKNGELECGLLSRPNDDPQNHEEAITRWAVALRSTRSCIEFPRVDGCWDAALR